MFRVLVVAIIVRAVPQCLDGAWPWGDVPFDQDESDACAPRICDVLTVRVFGVAQLDLMRDAFLGERSSRRAVWLRRRNNDEQSSIKAGAGPTMRFGRSGSMIANSQLEIL